LDALALARRLGDTDAMFSAAFFHLGQNDSPRHWEERVHLAEECAGWPRQGIRDQTLSMALFQCGVVHFSNADRTRAEELWREVQELAEKTLVAAPAWNLAAANALQAILDGHLENALTLGRPLVHARRGNAWLLTLPVLYLGRADIWLSEFEEQLGLQNAARSWRAWAFAIQDGIDVRISSAYALCLAQLGRLEEARRVVRPLLDEVTGGFDDETPCGPLAVLLQAAVVLEERGAVRNLLARLSSAGHLCGDTSVVTLVARHLGDGALLLGDRAAAHAFYAQALETAGKLRFRPEVALAHLNLAQLLLQEGPGTKAARAEGVTHLASAIPELRDMRMRPALERALALSNKLQRESVEGSAVPVASDGLTTRETEIASLVADGLTNRDIAERLDITEGTVKVHVKHILGKLGFKSRTELAVWLLRHD
jgi:DNA-binding CsgD family transcriptional regulator